MAYKSIGILYAIIKEATFNQGGTFTDSDTVAVTSDTNLKPEVDTIERKAKSNSFVKLPALAGKEKGSGTLGMELVRKSDGTIAGDVVLEVALGIKEPAGDGTGAIIDSDNHKITEVDSGTTGTATLYKLNKPCGTQDSIAVKEMLGCETADSQSLTLKGIVPNSVDFDFATADIATISFDLGASSFDTASGETLLASPEILDPIVGKNAVFTVDGTTYTAKNLKYTVSNTVSDREAITSSGIDSKEVTAKEIKGSFTIDFEGWAELNKFKDNADAEIYLELETGGKKFAVYIPKAKYSSVGIDDDDGVLVNNIEFMAGLDDNNEAIYVAVEV
jgi:hypothetical protein